jgi:hypothetical protein
MKKLILLWICITIAFICCKNDSMSKTLIDDISDVNDYLSKLNFKDDSSMVNINGCWKCYSYEDYKNNSITFKSDVQPSAKDVILTFENDSLYGKVTLYPVHGKYTLSGRKFQIISLFWIKTGVPHWGLMFYDIVYKLDSFAVNNAQLRLFYNDSNNSVTFNKNP